MIDYLPATVFPKDTDDMGILQTSLYLSAITGYAGHPLLLEMDKAVIDQGDASQVKKLFEEFKVKAEKSGADAIPRETL